MSPVQIPEKLTLNGRIIMLRNPQEEDFPHLQKILSDPITMSQLRYMSHESDGGWTIEQVRERHANWADKQRKQNCIDFAVVQKSTGTIAGSCGFTTVNLQHKSAVFGLIIHNAFWGKGIAAECHLLCLEYGFEKLGLHRIEFNTFVTNDRMRNFFEKIEVEFEGIKKEAFFENGVFKDDAAYVAFENKWPTIKKNLQARIQKQAGFPQPLIWLER